MLHHNLEELKAYKYLSNIISSMKDRASSRYLISYHMFCDNKNSLFRETYQIKASSPSVMYELCSALTKTNYDMTVMYGYFDPDIGLRLPATCFCNLRCGFCMLKLQLDVTLAKTLLYGRMGQTSPEH